MQLSHTRSHLWAFMEVRTCAFTVCLSDLCKAFKSNILCFQTLVQMSRFTPLGSFPKRARAARCWPECAACLLHSINMPSSRSLFNQRSEFLKVDLPPLEDILTSFHATKMLSKQLIIILSLSNLEAQIAPSSHGVLPLRLVNRLFLLTA